MRSLIVIPARLASTRLPEKLLLDRTGKSVIQHTYEAACRSRSSDGVLVAVDHERIAEVVTGFGGRFLMTDPNAQSGTDRVAEVARANPEIDIFVNVQGDEPEISGESIDLVIELLHRHSQADVATLCTPIANREDWMNPACVKTVCDHQGFALYFSRSSIPFDRSNQIEWESNFSASSETVSSFRAFCLQHVGIYGYRRSFLMELGKLPPCPLEDLEKLEQLRFLYAGKKIVTQCIAHHPRGIDTAEDYDAFVRRWHGG